MTRWNGPTKKGTYRVRARFPSRHVIRRRDLFFILLDKLLGYDKAVFLSLFRRKFVIYPFPQLNYKTFISSFCALV